MVAQVIGWENVTSKTPKTSIFQSCHVGLYHADCFLPVACEQMRRCGLGTGKKGSNVRVKVKYRWCKWLAVKGMGSFNTCLTHSTLISNLCVGVCMLPVSLLVQIM